MKLHALDIRELAQFFAKRFPQSTERARLARLAHVSNPDVSDPTQAWTDVLRAAQEQGTVHLLALGARRTLPDDENLQLVCGLLRQKRIPSGRTVAAAAGLLLLVVGGGAAAMVGRSPAPTALSEAEIAFDSRPVASSVARPVAEVPLPSEALDLPTVQEHDVATLTLPPAPIPVPEAQVVASVVTPAVAVIPVPEPMIPVPEPMVEMAPVPIPVPETPEAAAAADPVVSQVTREPAVAQAVAETSTPGTVQRCARDPGTLVGYWYAGPQAPGEAGDTITVATSVNVRLDYPRQDNAFDTRSPIQCALGVGDQVLLREAPIAVPPGAWWVPLYSGDLYHG